MKPSALSVLESPREVCKIINDAREQLNRSMMPRPETIKPKKPKKPKKQIDKSNWFSPTQQFGPRSMDC